MFVCYICKKQFATPNILIDHLKYIHNLNSTSHFVCDQGYCPQVFNSINSFRKHLMRHSITKDEEYQHADIDNISNHPNEISQPDPLNFFSNEIPPNYSNTNLIMKSIQETLQNSALTFICKLHSYKNLSRKCVTDIQSDVNNYIISSISEGMKKILDFPEDVRVNFKTFVDIIQSPFKDFSTEHSLLKILQEKELISLPTHFLIHNEVDSITKQSQGVLGEKKETGVLMPIKFQIKQFFELPNVLSFTIENIKNLENNLNIQNFINGELWQNKKLSYEKNDLIIPYFIFIDDFEVNNPLGSHRGTNKLTAVYYSFPVLPTEYLSSLENIFVAALFQSKNNTMYGNDACFSALLKEIESLGTEGIILNINGEEQKVYFILGLILGDNLGLNTALGFVKSFNSNSYCRFCNRKKNLMQFDTLEFAENLRK